MADVRKIRVMISSRSLTPVFGGTQLQEIRERLRTFLHGVRWQQSGAGGITGRDQSLFDVWIHEDDIGRAANTTTLEMSLREINNADIILVLYTGEAGSAHSDAELGICHAELKEALDRRNELVMVMELLPLSTSTAAKDISFREYVRRLEIPRMQVNDEASLQNKIAEALQERIAQLVRRGGNVGTRKRDRGQALDWNRLDLSARRQEMCDALIDSLPAQEISVVAEGIRPLHLMKMPSGQKLAVRIDAIPAAFSVAAARERVGQPFMQDHRYATALKQCGAAGVVHIIACHKGVTETQATNMLGTPDAMSVASDFGVYAADHVQKIQIIFLSQCSDKTAVALAVRRLREWLVQSGEEMRLVERAVSRGRILDAIAGEQK